MELVKHLPPYMVAANGHMKQISRNTNSTKTQVTPPNEDEPMEALETRSNHIFANIIDPQQRIATNLTRRFPVTSNRGNK